MRPRGAGGLADASSPKGCQLCQTLEFTGFIRTLPIELLLVLDVPFDLCFFKSNGTLCKALTMLHSNSSKTYLLLAR